ncbi:MAG: basic amino acid ABC transporter substrate-binding protein [Spirochaeta sp.]|jgi:polar amino acid transport system substrate-binding protein|nr:basic amino acid ABC transporter substrate-binding protein [Spirochaeta sp.]
MKRMSLGLLAIALVAMVGLVSCQPEDESDVATLTVATDATWPPMEFLNTDQEIVGFDIDLMNAIAEAEGFNVEFQNTAWDGIFAGLANGDYDAVISSVTITDERKRTMDFSTPYINAGQVLIVRQDAPSDWESLEDLAGESVGAQIGTTGAIEVGNTDGVELRTYDELGLAIEDLSQGRIAGVVADTPIAADYVLQNDNYNDVLQIVGDAFTEEFYGVAVKKGNDEVLEMVNAGLEVVLNDGTVEELKDTWLR